MEKVKIVKIRKNQRKNKSQSQSQKNTKIVNPVHKTVYHSLPITAKKSIKNMEKNHHLNNKKMMMIKI